MSFLNRKKRPRRSETVGVFFATDLHGSDYCFRKFLNAKAAYGADVLILGGDLTGKLAVPVVHESDGSRSVYAPGAVQRVGPKDFEQTDQHLRRAGYYPFDIHDAAGLEQFVADPDRVAAKHHELMEERLEQWSAWAVEKLGEDAEILVAPGNDDPYFVDDVLGRLAPFRLVENTIVDDAIPGLEIELVSSGVSNETPWKTHRELPESELQERLEQLASGVRDPERAIFNLHVPPYDSSLDEGPIIDPSTLKQTPGATVPVGSTAVKEVIERHQPALSLHGHIHESRAVTHIGRTLAINPGSDYGDGILRGAFVEMTADGPVGYQLTSG
jgi:uncharacterized protein